MRRFFLKFLFVPLSLLIVGCGTCNVAGLNTQTSATESWKNTGTVKGPQNTGFQDRLIGFMADQVITQLYGSKKGDTVAGIVGNRKFEEGLIYQIYRGIVSSFEYRAIYYLTIVLYIIILGITYLMGMSQMTIEKVIPIIIKIGIISLFTNPSITGGSNLPIGWEYYNALIVSPALGAMEDFAIYFCSVLFDWDVSNVTNGFIPLTVVLGMLATEEFWIKMTSLIFTNVLMGLPTFLMVLLTMLSFTVMMLFGITAYVVALTMLGMLFAVGPFFFMFLLFEKTKAFFTRWMSNIISLMLQQYTLFITVAVFGFIISQSLESMLAFKMKCTPIIAFNLRIPLLPPIPRLCQWFGGDCKAIMIVFPLWSYYTMHISDNATFMTLFMYSLFLYMLIKLFGAMVEYTTALGGELVAGTVNATSGSASEMKKLGDKGVDWASEKVSSAATDAGLKVMAMPYNYANKAIDIGKNWMSKKEDGGKEQKGNLEQAGGETGKATGKVAGQGAGAAIDTASGGATGGAGQMVGGMVGAQTGQAVGSELGKAGDKVANEVQAVGSELEKVGDGVVNEAKNAASLEPGQTAKQEGSGFNANSNTSSSGNAGSSSGPSGGGGV